MTQAVCLTASSPLRLTAPSPHSIPRAPYTRLPQWQLGLNLEGAVTGTYFDASGALHGYVRAANGTITEFNVTGAGTGSGQGTDSSSINDLGVITGNYIDSNGVNHGYVRAAIRRHHHIQRFGRGHRLRPRHRT